MRCKNLIVVAIAALVAVPVFAQEKEAAKESAPSMLLPKPLEDALCKWMVGEWEGWGTSPMGKTQDWHKVEWRLDNQFLMTYYTSKWSEMNAEGMKAWAESMKMSKEDLEKMKEMVYKAMGPLTIDPVSGEYMGYWFDNWRGVYKGTGKREGNKITMTWEGPMGTSVHTVEKVSDDKMVITFKETDPSGNVMEGRTELTRKKASMAK